MKLYPGGELQCLNVVRCKLVAEAPPGLEPEQFAQTKIETRDRGDPRKSPAQLNSGRQLALLVEDGADCVGIGLCDEEHPESMVTRRTAGKRVPLVSIK
jgi:hypothetical protein